MFGIIIISKQIPQTTGVKPMRKTLAVLGLCALASIAVAAGQPRWKTVAADQNWLRSDGCSVSNTVEIPEVGMANDQCALEADLKKRLREGPIDFGPTLGPGI